MTCGLPPRGGLPDLSAKSLALNPKELAEITCAVARLTAMLCNVMQVGDTAAAGVAEQQHEPYIWDEVEPHAHY